MKTNLSKKEKIYLTIIAILIGGAWFMPSVIKRGRPKSDDGVGGNTTTKIKEDNKALEKAINYLGDLKELSPEELAKTLNIPDSTMTGYKITNAAYNAQNAKFDIQIQIGNSYLKALLFLEKLGEDWEVKEIETSNKLGYSSEGIKLYHPFDWEIILQEVGEGLADSWVLQPKDSKNMEGQQLLFLVEGLQGNYSAKLTDCVLEEISECSEETLGSYTYKTSEVGNQEVKILSRNWENGGLIIVVPHGTNYTEDGTEINDILKSISF